MKDIKFTGCNCKVTRGEFDSDDIPLDCPAVYKMLAAGHTTGVFQLEKKLGKDWAQKVKPENIEEISILIAILRPGSLECISGDTRITKGRFYSTKKQKYMSVYCSVEKLYQQFLSWKNLKFKGRAQNGLCILSLNEDTYELFNNTISNVIKTGLQEVYKLKLKLVLSGYNDNRKQFYIIKTTDKHKFLTLNGWKELRELQRGDYIAIINKNFGQIKRKDSLHTEGLIHRSEIENKLLKVKLPNKNNVRWVLYEGKESCGLQETYDISVNGPFYNYIASNIVVHNSGQAQQYVDTKFGYKKSNVIHPLLEPILKSTHGCLVYQEQVLRIAIDLARFNPEQADMLRYAVGKKKPELMAKLKNKFIDGCVSNNISNDIAERIFGWIEKCQKYLFNKSHSISYSMLTYITCWLKCHFPREFFTSYLTYSKYKSDPKEEIYNLVQDARFFGLNVVPPDIKRGNIDFEMIDNNEGIAFGLSHIRSVGKSALEKIKSSDKLNTWPGFLLSVPQLHRDVGLALIKSGACDCYDKEQSEMIRELELVLGNEETPSLTSKEKEFFFNRFNDFYDIKDIFNEMGNTTPKKPLSQRNKSELLNILNNHIDIKDRLLDIDGEIIYNLDIERTALKDQLSKRKKADLLILLDKNGYKDTRKKSPCANSRRRQIMLDKAKLLDEPIEYTNTAKAITEKYFLGISLSCSAVDDVDEHNATHTCLDVARSVNDEIISVCGIIDNVKMTQTKRGKNPGQQMCFLTLSDSTYSLESVVVFPDKYKELKAFCRQDLIGVFRGKKSKGSFIIEDITKVI